MLLFHLGLVAGGCTSGGSARTDYYAARSIRRNAQAGDGSTVGIAPQAGSASWSASLTFVPIAHADGLADGR